MNKLKYIMFASLLILAVSCGLKGSNYWLTPLAEWVTTILYLGYFAMLSFTNLYYDSVHAYDSAATSAIKNASKVNEVQSIC